MVGRYVDVDDVLFIIINNIMMSFSGSERAKHEKVSEGR